MQKLEAAAAAAARHVRTSRHNSSCGRARRYNSCGAVGNEGVSANERAAPAPGQRLTTDYSTCNMIVGARKRHLGGLEFRFGQVHGVPRNRTRCASRVFSDTDLGRSGDLTSFHRYFYFFHPVLKYFLFLADELLCIGLPTGIKYRDKRRSLKK